MSADEIAKGANQARQIDPIGRCVVLDQNLMASKLSRGRMSTCAKLKAFWNSIPAWKQGA